MSANVWKLQDAKARFSEVVRNARTGEPQHVTVHGQEAVVVVDPKRFDIRAKSASPMTSAEFIERSKKYRGLAEGIEFEQRFPMIVDPRPLGFDEDKT